MKKNDRYIKVMKDVDCISYLLLGVFAFSVFVMLGGAILNHIIVAFALVAIEWIFTIIKVEYGVKLMIAYLYEEVNETNENDKDEDEE